MTEPPDPHPTGAIFNNKMPKLVSGCKSLAEFSYVFADKDNASARSSVEKYAFSIEFGLSYAQIWPQSKYTLQNQ